MKLIACLLLCVGIGSSAELRAGAAQVVITPPKGAPMAGYYHNRAAAGVHDELHAKAIVFEKDGVKVALVACDLASLPPATATAARQQVQQRLNIPPSHVMLSATHTHTGPVLLTEGSRYNLQGDMQRLAVEYSDGLAGKIADAVQAADASLKPAVVRTATGREDSLTFNRRFHMINGSVGWNPGKLNPKIVRPAGPIDGSVPLVYVESTDGKPIAAYVNYALHLDTVGGMQYSADYPYTLSKILSAATGEGLITLFTIGCAGNLNHIDVSTKKPQKGHEEAARIGAVLAGEVLKTLKRAPVVEIDKIRASSETLQLALPPAESDDLDWARKTSATFDQPNAAPFIDLVKAGRIVSTAGRNGKPIDGEVQVISLGDQIAFVGLPGEMFTEHGLAAKQGSPFPQTVTVGLANGSVGYVPDYKAFAQGAYEVISSRTAAGSGEKMVGSAIQQLVRQYQKP